MKTTTIIIFLISIFSIGFSKPVEKKYSPTIWYYIGRNGINTCAEPDPVYPCTTEMHVVHTKEYYPYAIWYEFYHGKNNDTLDYNIWYNFNDTTSSLIDTHSCNNGIKNTSLTNITDFISALGIDVVLQHNCTYNTHTNVVEQFDMYQTTTVNNNIQSNIIIAIFVDWTFQLYPSIKAENLESQMTMQTTPQDKYAMCRFCKDRKCLNCNK